MTTNEFTVSQVVSFFHDLSSTASRIENSPSPASEPRHHHHHKGRSSRALLLTQEGSLASRLRAQMGNRKERQGIDAYELKTGRKVIDRNEKTHRVMMHVSPSVHVNMRGRPDGICPEIKAIIEHKYRPRGLLGYVPDYERVQCHLYMKMFGLKMANLVETFNTHVQIHEVPFDDNVWAKICEALVRHTRASDLHANMQVEDRPDG